MAISQIFDGLTIPGQSVTLNTFIPIGAELIVVNLVLEVEEVRPWGFLLVGAFYDSPIAAVAIIKSTPLYARAYRETLNYSPVPVGGVVAYIFTPTNLPVVPVRAFRDF